MRRKLVVGNWKMHGSRTQVRELVEGVAIGTADLKNVEIAVGPTLLHMASPPSYVREKVLTT